MTHLNFQRIIHKHPRKYLALGLSMNHMFKVRKFAQEPLRNYSNHFSLEQKQLCIERLKKFNLSQQYEAPSSQKIAAVLIPLCNVDNEMSLLYTLRKQDLRRHQGQVSFPGGVQDVDDSSVEFTALRETEEELGISRASVDVWGHGNPIVGKEYNIYPVVGYVGDLKIDDLKPNFSEVEFAFTVPLTHFHNPNNCCFTQFRNKKGYTLPVFVNSKCKIWGLTALITHLALTAICPQKYSNRLQFIKPLKFV